MMLDQQKGQPKAATPISAWQHAWDLMYLFEGSKGFVQSPLGGTGRVLAEGSAASWRHRASAGRRCPAASSAPTDQTPGPAAER